MSIPFPDPPQNEWVIIRETRLWYRPVRREIVSRNYASRDEAAQRQFLMQSAEQTRLERMGVLDYRAIIDPVENYVYSLAHIKDLDEIDWNCREESGQED